MLNRIIPTKHLSVPLFGGGFNEFPFGDLWKLMFYSIPEEPKPPMAIDVIGDEPNESDEISNPKLIIQLALAGFKKEDIKIFTKNKDFIISGDNTKNEMAPLKFRSKFEKRFPYKDTVDIDKTEVTFEDGILTVTLPFIQPKDNKLNIWP